MPRGMGRDSINKRKCRAQENFSGEETMPLRDAISEGSGEWTTARKVYVGCGCGCLVLIAVMLIAVAVIASVVLDKRPVTDAANMLPAPAMGMFSARIDGNDPATKDLVEHAVARMRNARMEGLPPDTQQALRNLRGDQLQQVISMASPLQVALFMARPGEGDAAEGEGVAHDVTSAVISLGRGGFLIKWLVANQMETLIVSKQAISKNFKGIPYCMIGGANGESDGRTIGSLDNNLVAGSGTEMTEALFAKLQEKEPAPTGRLELMSALNNLDQGAEVIFLMSNNGNMLKGYLEELSEKSPEVSLFMKPQEGQARSAFDQAALKAVGFSIDIQAGNTAKMKIAAPSHEPKRAAAMITKAVEKLTKKHPVKLTVEPTISGDTAVAELEIGNFVLVAESVWQAVQPETQTQSAEAPADTESPKNK